MTSTTSDINIDWILKRSFHIGLISAWSFPISYICCFHSVIFFCLLSVALTVHIKIEFMASLTNTPPPVSTNAINDDKLSGKLIIKAQLGDDIRKMMIHNEDLTLNGT